MVEKMDESTVQTLGCSYDAIVKYRHL